MEIKLDTDIKLKNILFLFTVIVIVFAVGCLFGGMSLGNVVLKDIFSPVVILFSAASATFMANRAVKNSRRSDCLKNTLDAINNDMFFGEKRNRLEKACSLLNERLLAIGSFKAHCRLKNRASEFVEDFRSDHPKEYESIVDAICYADKLCHGVEEDIYDERIINRFLGETVFDVWWAGMVIIREKELEYFDETNKEYKRKPNFGSPYSSLYNWVESISDAQGLEQVKFVRGRLDVGYHNREAFREHEELAQE